MFIESNFSTKCVNREFYIQNKWVRPRVFVPGGNEIPHNFNSLPTSFVKKHIYARVAYLALVPISATAHAFDTVIGVLAGGISIFTGNGKLSRIANNALNSSETLLSFPLMCFLRVFNPSAKVHRRRMMQTNLATKVIITKLADHCAKSDNLFSKHLGSRLLYVGLAITSIATRVLDFCLLGVTASILTTITIGKYRVLNEIAYSGLQVTGVISDVYFSLFKAINPQRSSPSMMAVPR